MNTLPKKISLLGLSLICCIFIGYLLIRQPTIPSHHPTLENLEEYLSRNPAFQSSLKSFGPINNLVESSYPPNLLDNLDAHLEFQTDENLQHALANEALPPHPWQVDRVNAIASEELAELLENIANFDDIQFIATAAPTIACMDCPEYTVYASPASFRVRKLLQLANDNPSDVSQVLRATLRESLGEWPDTLIAHANENYNADGSIKPGGRTEPANADKLKHRIRAAMYVLAEMKDCTSLPLLHQVIKVQQQWAKEHPYPYTCHTPSPQILPLCAMHRLVASLPDGGLSVAASKARYDYLEWAEERLQKPKVLIGVTPDSPYDENDPYVNMIDPVGFIVSKEPQMVLVEYPVLFADKSPVQEDYWELELSEGGQEWLDKLKL